MVEKDILLSSTFSFLEVRSFFLKNNIVDSMELLSAVLFNICTYTISVWLIFTVLLIVNSRVFTTTNTLRSIISTSLPVYMIAVFSALLSFAGLPPLIGFCSKLLLFNFILKNTSFLTFIVFFVFNCFIFYFYVQNCRFLVPTNTTIYIHINKVLTHRPLLKQNVLLLLLIMS
jgi:NADH:ubiquinone oxidoreductase subunit 2 (subunit N)